MHRVVSDFGHYLVCGIRDLNRKREIKMLFLTNFGTTLNGMKTVDI